MGKLKTVICVVVAVVLIVLLHNVVSRMSSNPYPHSVHNTFYKELKVNSVELVNPHFMANNPGITVKVTPNKNTHPGSVYTVCLLRDGNKELCRTVSWSKLPSDYCIIGSCYPSKELFFNLTESDTVYRWYYTEQQKPSGSRSSLSSYLNNHFKILITR